MRLGLSSRPAEASRDDFALKKSLMFTNALRQLRHRFNRPFMVMFETTLHCNMKCGYCAIWQNQQPEDRAVRERVFARMDEAAEFGVFAWSMSGGEDRKSTRLNSSHSQISYA